MGEKKYEMYNEKLMKIRVSSKFGIRSQSIKYFKLTYKEIRKINLNQFTLEEIDFFISILKNKNEDVDFLISFILESDKKSRFIDYPLLFEEYIVKLISKGLYKEAKKFMVLYKQQCQKISIKFIKKQRLLLKIINSKDEKEKQKIAEFCFQKSDMYQYQFLLELYSLKEIQVVKHLLNKLLKIKNKGIWKNLLLDIKKYLF